MEQEIREARFEALAELLTDFASALEAECVRIKQRVKKLVERELGLDEKVFTILNWEPKSSGKLGEFEIAAKDKNALNAWNHAYNILKTNEANIKNHFGLKEWKYYYWLFDGYPDVIFRKKRNSA